MSVPMSHPRWSIADLADALAEGVRAMSEALDREQAVRGFDLADEVDLHPPIAAALIAAGYGVHRECRFPADRAKRRQSEGERCDVVITHDGRTLRAPDHPPTLFDPADAVPLDDAFWMEVKTVSQFRESGPNPTYASQLLSTVRKDVTKLSKDAGILHAGLLLLLFVERDDVAEHDLNVWQDRCLQRGLPIGAPARRSIPITDRHGHGICALALYPVHRM
jgi:hypothetical protein